MKKAYLYTALFYLLIYNSLLFSQESRIDYGKYKVLRDTTYDYIIDTTSNKVVIKSGKYTHLQIEVEDELILAQNKQEKQGYIDIHENIIIPFCEDVGVFSNNLIFAKRNGLYGYLNRNNKVIIDFKYSTGAYFHKPGIAIVKYRHGKYGVIDTLGREIIPLIYDGIEQENDTILAVNKKNKWAIFNSEGMQLTPFIYDEIILSSMKPPSKSGLGYIDKGYINHGAIIVKKEGKYSFLNNRYEEIFPNVLFEEIMPLNYYGISIVLKEGKYGILNISQPKNVNYYDSIYLQNSYKDEPIYCYYAKEGKKIIILDTLGINSLKIKFDSINFLANNFSIAYSNGTPYFINSTGNIITSEYKELIENYYDDLYILARKDTNYGIINFNNEQVISFNFQDIKYNKYIKHHFVKKNGLWGVIDSQEKVLIPCMYEYITKACCYKDNEKPAFIVKKNGKYGTVDTNNNAIIPIEYDKISDWVEYGPDAHFVKKDGKIGIISHSGKILIPTIYSNLYYLNDSFIVVNKGDSVGIVKIDNSIIIPIIYEDLFYDYYFIDFYSQKDIKIYALRKGVWRCFDRKGKKLKNKMTIEERNKYFEKKKAREEYLKHCKKENKAIETIEDEYFYEVNEFERNTQTRKANPKTMLP